MNTPDPFSADAAASAAADQLIRAAIDRIFRVASTGVAHLRAGWRNDPIHYAVIASVDAQVEGVEIAHEVGGEPLVEFLRSAEATAAVERLLAARLLSAVPTRSPSRVQPRRRTLRRKARRVYRDSGLQDLAREEEERARQAEQERVFRKSLEREFRLLFALAVRRPVDQISGHADRIFHALAERAETQLREVSPQRSHPISNERLRALLDSVEPRIELLSGEVDVDAISRFERQYVEAIAASSAYMSPPHVDREYRVRLTDLYVDPAFEPAKRSGDTPTTVDFAALLARLDRTVVCGAPGAGKSMLAQALSHGITAESRTIATKNLTPFVVVLRKYAKQRNTEGYSMIEHIEQICRVPHHLEPPAGAIEYLLVAGRGLVIFDGLDELPSTAERRSIRDEIESFARRFPASHVLVTSRVVGYAASPLNESDFERFDIAPFDTDRVEQYAHVWFSLQRGMAEDESAEKTTAFLRESEREAADLRANPLILALLCALYRGEGSIPSTRPEIYRRCSDLLQRTWDTRRDIEVQRPLGSHLEATLCHLALWLFRTPSLQAGVERRAIVRSCANYLASRRTGDLVEATEAAEEFFEWCRGRAWVITEVGRDRFDDALFGFVHKTFLEYYAALGEARLARTPADLAIALRELIELPGADVVATLAVQIAQDQREGAGDEVLLEMASRDQGANDLQIAFAARALRYVVPPPAVTDAVTANATEVMLDSRARALASVRIEGAGPRDDALSVEDIVSGPDVVQRVAAKRITLGLREALATGGNRAQAAASLVMDHFEEREFDVVAAQLVTGYYGPEDRRVLIALADSDREVALRLAAANAIAPDLLLARHGPAALYEFPVRISRGGLPIWGELPLASRIIGSCIGSGADALSHARLTELGLTLTRCERPWFRGGLPTARSPLSEQAVERLRDRGAASIDEFVSESGDASALAGLVLLAVPFLELFRGIWPSEIEGTPVLGFARRFGQERLLRAQNPDRRGSVAEFPPGTSVHPALVDFLNRWMNGSISTLSGGGPGAWERWRELPAPQGGAVALPTWR